MTNRATHPATATLCYHSPHTPGVQVGATATLCYHPPHTPGVQVAATAAGSSSGARAASTSSAVSRPDPGPAPPKPPSALAVGCTVTLAQGFEKVGDAKAGPLKPGQLGKVIEKNGSSWKVKVTWATRGC